MSKSTGDDDDREEKTIWDGSNDGLEDFNKRLGRWCRKKLGTTFGNHFWHDTLPNLAEIIDGPDWNLYAEEVWDSINDYDPAKAKVLYHMSSGFWNKS